MRSFICAGFLAAVLSAALAPSVSAASWNHPLLALVPPGSQVVAGFENHPAPHTHGRLLLTTHNNRLDLDDWQALTGVDNKRIFEQVIEVASAPGGRDLSEHMLLVAGQFDRDRIFRSLTENGAAAIAYEGIQVVVVKPLARERGDMLDDRWLLILNNRIGIFGTPWLVQQALRRSAEHALPDPILEERLSLLRRDVNSWNILLSSPETARNVSFRQPHSAWAQLQQDADVMTVAARFGPRIRIDFSIYADSGRGRDFFARKAEFFTDALGTRPAQNSMPAHSERRLAKFSLEPNHVQGSVEMSSQQFEVWCEHLYLAQASLPPAASTGD
jgi:hypothetical protein